MARKKKKNNEEDGADIGVVMTCSLFLIILTFFILLNSIAVVDDKRTRLAIGSLTYSFGSFHDEISAFKKSESFISKAPPIEKQTIKVNKLIRSINNNLHLGWSDIIKVINMQDRNIININEKALFEMETHRLKPEASLVLDRLCNLINSGQYPVEIVGHTDNRPAEEKGYKSNWELTGLMAIQVQKYFVDKGDVEPKRLTAYGYAGYNSIASNDTWKSREQNRRIEIICRYQIPVYMKKIFDAPPAGNFTYKRFNFRIF